jgi:hypothetical protein
MKAFRLLGIGVCLLATGCIVEHTVTEVPNAVAVGPSPTEGDRNEQLQAAFLQFPLLDVRTNDVGDPVFQTLNFTNPVVIDGTRYYGFRFQVPQRANREDFIWAFVEPQQAFHWYIVPQTGGMTGFTHFDTRPIESLVSEQLFPVKGINLCLQALSGEDLQDDETYLIWFGFEKGKPEHLSLKFAFAAQVADSTNEVKAIKNALALKRVPNPPRPVDASLVAELLIISATYGSGTHYADVTSRVNDLLRQPGVDFYARPQWLEADPTPGWNKALVIVYEFKGQRHIFTTGEGGRVNVTDLLKEAEQ